jgi:hypothetical protein
LSTYQRKDRIFLHIPEHGGDMFLRNVVNHPQDNASNDHSPQKYLNLETAIYMMGLKTAVILT